MTHLRGHSFIVGRVRVAPFHASSDGVLLDRMLGTLDIDNDAQRESRDREPGPGLATVEHACPEYAESQYLLAVFRVYMYGAIHSPPNIHYIMHIKLAGFIHSSSSSLLDNTLNPQMCF